MQLTGDSRPRSLMSFAGRGEALALCGPGVPQICWHGGAARLPLMVGQVAGLDRDLPGTYSAAERSAGCGISGSQVMLSGEDGNYPS
jgi:hypothetical protein